MPTPSRQSRPSPAPVTGQGGSATPAAPSVPVLAGLAHPLPAGMRDLLPAEARSRRVLGKKLLDHFALHGYELVTPPLFELAEVLERGLGTLDPGDVLRFVEPDSGEVAALRPDMTPQIARMTATRLADRPPPIRLCYDGTVLRRRRERARKHRQIPQTGVELLGVGGPEGDLELLELAASASRAAGLDRFVVEIGHADIARTLVSQLRADCANLVLHALAHKDAAGIAALVAGEGLPPNVATALSHLASLHGDAGIWGEADRLLGATPAAPAFATLRDLWNRAARAGLEPILRTDLGEVRGFAYYTGTIFHLFADGPGEPLGSGGRYDDLLGRFGAPMQAAGFALDLDNLAWSLRTAGKEDGMVARLLMAPVEGAGPLCRALRQAGVSCAVGPAAEPLAYARAWGFSHAILGRRPLEWVEVATGRAERLGDLGDAEATAVLAARLGSR